MDRGKNSGLWSIIYTGGFFVCLFEVFFTAFCLFLCSFFERAPAVSLKSSFLLVVVTSAHHQQSVYAGMNKCSSIICPSRGMVQSLAPAGTTWFFSSLSSRRSVIQPQSIGHFFVIFKTLTYSMTELECNFVASEGGKQEHLKLILEDVVQGVSLEKGREGGKRVRTYSKIRTKGSGASLVLCKTLTVVFS